MVYSTCSLNPIENEAVVCALLTQSEVSLRLVDIRAEGRLPALKSREGVYTWEVSEAIVAVGETMAERQSTLARCPTFTPSMHPPATEEVARSLHLERCMRILPHDNNTGGFFIALLEKVELANEGPALTSSSSQLSEKKKKVKTALSKAESLHALRQLGFNPRQSSEASTADEWRGITGAQSFREIEATAEGIEIVNTLGLDSLCAEREGMPRLLRYQRAVERKKEEERKKSVVFATTAADIDPLLVNKKKRRRINNRVDSSVHDEVRNRDEETLKDASAGIVMVSDSVAKALSSWATSKFVVQAGIPVFYDRFAAGRWELDADGITPLLPYITRGIVPLSIQVMMHLLRHLVKGHTISKGDAYGLTLGVEDSSKTLTREYQLLPPIETNIEDILLLSEDLYTALKSSNSEIIVATVDPNHFEENGHMNECNSASHDKRRMSKAERKKQKSKIIIEMKASVSMDAVPEKMESVKDAAILSSRELAIVFQRSMVNNGEGSTSGTNLTLLTPLDRCSSYLDSLNAMQLL